MTEFNQSSQNNLHRLKDANAHHRHEVDRNHYLLPFLLILIFSIVEAIGSWYTGSLALLSDTGHMFTDVAALGLAWLASSLAKKSNVKRHHSGVTYAELVVSIFNAVTMLAVIIFVIYEAIARLKQPHAVQGLGLMIIASLGLIVNLVVAKLLHQQVLHHGESLNNHAAFLHVMGDLLGSIAAVAAGVVIYFSGWLLIDPILSLLISILLLVFTLNLVRDILLTIHGKASLAKHDHENSHLHGHEHKHDH